MNGVGGERILIGLRTDPAGIDGTHDVPEWVRGVQFAPGLAVRVAGSTLEVAVTDAW